MMNITKKIASIDASKASKPAKIRALTTAFFADNSLERGDIVRLMIAIETIATEQLLRLHVDALPEAFETFWKAQMDGKFSSIRSVAKSAARIAWDERTVRELS